MSGDRKSDSLMTCGSAVFVQDPITVWISSFCAGSYQVSGVRKSDSLMTCVD